ncbi:MAG: DinB family protein [Candidatus Kariarchaeaceae archaeon]
MDLQGFVDTCIDLRERLHDHVETINRENRWHQTTSNGWRMVEVVGHILWYEHQMIHLLTEKNLGNDPHWELDHSERNIKIVQNYAKYTPDMIWDEFETVGSDLIAALRSIDPAELDDPEKFEMPPDWKPYDILDQNLVGHYRQHLSEL